MDENKKPAGDAALLRLEKLKKILNANLDNDSMEIKISYQVDLREDQRLHEAGYR